ncbi:MAG: hypothetical protein HN846_04710 [Candidatus Pacebacteria bacterium]|nr:hypothetical protein [Candidatus Paceibacterota bacterium]MBT3511739.1 hypothetical protein [Candidatus Paceibacterota bacterium]MBT4004804.1 hypothetical protein [Candidatus Paceibacterota bacterium]MBT4358489.1 hypothetical protein [Candidatus Paceibacterota bacterium]MBT4680615.1 hypothetical protein [Candidatus Paceibacterota bacterium]
MNGQNIRTCELESNWVEPMSASLERIVDVMEKWFKPNQVGFVPIIA